MVGLDKVKSTFDTLVARGITEAQRAELGLEIPDRQMHMVFAGPPGTGKTTAARILARAYGAIGLTNPNKKPVEVTGSELKSEFQTGSTKIVQDIFNKARGGVLFVDEAYGIVSGPHDEPGVEALTELMRLSNEHKNDTVVILAGYDSQTGDKDVIEHLAKYNPGIKRRFPTRVQFESYTDEQLGDIGERKAKASQLGFDSKETRAAFRSAAAVAGSIDQQNAGGVDTLMAKIVDAQAVRLTNLGRKPKAADFKTLTLDDVAGGLQEVWDGPPPTEVPKKKKTARKKASAKTAGA